MSLDKILPTANCMFDTIKNTNILEKMKDKQASSMNGSIALQL